MTEILEKRKVQPRKQSIPLDDAADIVQKVEPIVSPMDIISKTGSAFAGSPSDDDIDAQYNPIEKQPGPSQIEEKIRRLNIGEQTGYVIEEVPVPQVRKVAIKKVPRFEFRLGLEKTAEKSRIMPGCTHRWMCDKKGNEFMTGLDGDNMKDTRKRLERALRVDLSSTSDFYASLNFALEDKEHGQIMNFDDLQMGPYYEVVYYAMLVSDLVANGLHEYSSGKKPFAEWYVENKEAEAEARQLDMTYDIEAMETFNLTSLDKRHGIAKLLKLSVWGVTDKVASVDLWDFVKKNAENAKAFLDIARMPPDVLNVSVLVKNALKINVLRRNKANDIVFANETLGPTEDHVVSKLVLPTNSTLRLAISRQVEGKQL